MATWREGVASAERRPLMIMLNMMILDIDIIGTLIHVRSVILYELF